MTTENNTKALQVQQPASPGALTSPGGWGIEGMEGLGAEDMIVPRWDVLQPTSRKEGTPGWFCLNLTGETAESVPAVILRISRTRVLWSGNPSDKVPECSSADGITGRTYGRCANCQFNTFDTKGGTAKICRQGYTYLAANPDSPEDLFLMSLYSTSATPAKILNSQFVKKHRSPFTAIVRFKTRQEVGDKGKYFINQPVIERWLEPAEWAPFQEASRAMQHVAIREVEPDEGPGTTGNIAADIASAQQEVQAQERGRGNPAAAPTELDSEGQSLWDSLGATKAGEGSKSTTTKAPF